MKYSIDLGYWIYVKSCGILSFAENMAQYI